MRIFEISFVSHAWLQSTLLHLPAASSVVLIVRKKNYYHGLSFTWVLSPDSAPFSWAYLPTWEQRVQTALISSHVFSGEGWRVTVRVLQVLHPCGCTNYPIFDVPNGQFHFLSFNQMLSLCGTWLAIGFKIKILEGMPLPPPHIPPFPMENWNLNEVIGQCVPSGSATFSGFSLTNHTVSSKFVCPHSRLWESAWERDVPINLLAHLENTV